MGGLVAAKGIEQVLGCLMKGIREKWADSYGEGTQFYLDYAKLFVIGLCIYIAMQVSQ